MEEVNSSNINPIGLLLLVALSLVMLQGRRPTAVKALLAIAAFIPLGQQVVVAGLHFQFFRILILIGYIRLFSRGETAGFKLTGVDKLFIAWASVAAICGALRDPGAIMGIRCLGGAFNAFGTYFLVRCLIKDPAEAQDQLRFLAFAVVVVASAMCCELFMHRNLFAVFGGVHEVPEFRNGRWRCQGPFEHAILAGTFAATLFPLLVGLWFQEKRKSLALAGIIACAFISGFAAASSGALLTCVTATIGIALWPLRSRMYLIRLAMVLTVFVLSQTMKSPVWYIIARASDVLGGTGWHRAYLIDQAVNHFNEWCLIGSSVTKHWAPAGQVLAADPNNMDITNHYIAQGLQGGLLGLGLFLAIITTCFKVIGRVVGGKRSLPLGKKQLWALGVGWACHCTAFISISYFDQMQLFWLWLLAVIAVVDQSAQSSAAGHPLRVPAPDADSAHSFAPS